MPQFRIHILRILFFLNSRPFSSFKMPPNFKINFAVASYNMKKENFLIPAADKLVINHFGKYLSS